MSLVDRTSRLRLGGAVVLALVFLPLGAPASGGFSGQHAPGQSPAPYSTWSDYGGSADSMQYSSLREIDKRNVSQLEQAWFYPVPDR